MLMHFVSTGPKFPYPYYIGVKSALKHYPGDVVLHVVSEPQSEYFNLLKSEPRLQIRPIEIDTSLPVFDLELWSSGNIANMKDNWKRVLAFDCLVWKLVAAEGGIIMGADSVTLGDWTHLLGDKEMLVPKRDGDRDGDYTMHGVAVRPGSALAAQIFRDIEGVMQGRDIPGRHRAIIDGKYRWGGAGICPFINRVLENQDKVVVADLEKYTLPMFASSMTGFDRLDEKFAEQSGAPLAQQIRAALTPAEYDPFGKLTRTVTMKGKKYRFHLLGLVHLPCSRRYMGCAFSQKNYKLAQMLLSLGHEVFYYGAEGSDVPCTEFIQTHTLSDIRKEWGDGDNRFEIGYDWQAGDFRHDFNAKRAATTLKFYEKCTGIINSMKAGDDFLLVTQGYYHKPIADRVKLFLTCEPGIGYRGSWCRFRSFESSYIQNYTYGSQHPFKCINGHYYDRVIPNYFDPGDFEYGSEKEDYYLYIGRLIKRKGVITADLVCRHLGAKLLLVGQGGEVKGGRLIAQDFTLEPGTWEYVGYADVEQRKPLMAKAIATFTPTEYLECFAGTHVESMLSGTPPITTNFGVFPGTIPDHLDGVVGFRCNTLQDFVEAAQKARDVDHKRVREYGERFLMDHVKWEYQRWFDDLYAVYESAVRPGVKGWSRLPDQEEALLSEIQGCDIDRIKQAVGS